MLTTEKKYCRAPELHNTYTWQSTARPQDLLPAVHIQDNLLPIGLHTRVFTYDAYTWLPPCTQVGLHDHDSFHTDRINEPHTHPQVFFCRWPCTSYGYENARVWKCTGMKKTGDENARVRTFQISVFFITPPNNFQKPFPARRARIQRLSRTDTSRKANLEVFLLFLFLLLFLLLLLRRRRPHLLFLILLFLFLFYQDRFKFTNLT